MIGNKPIAGRVKRLEISGELFCEFLSDGLVGHIRVENGIPPTGRFVYGYYDESFVGTSGYFVLVIEDDSFDWYEGAMNRCPSLMPIVHSLPD